MELLHFFFLKELLEVSQFVWLYGGVKRYLVKYYIPWRKPTDTPRSQITYAGMQIELMFSAFINR